MILFLEPYAEYGALLGNQKVCSSPRIADIQAHKGDGWRVPNVSYLQKWGAAAVTVVALEQTRH